MRGAFRHYITTGGNGQPDHFRSRSRLGLSANTREPTDAFIQTTSFAREKKRNPNNIARPSWSPHSPGLSRPWGDN